MTKIFIRTSEFLWQEGHTVHSNEKEAQEEVMLILDYYKDLIENYLAIPVLVGKKTEKEKFPGAVYTTCLEGLMPDGKALQLGTSHHLGQNFSKPFGITFLDKKQKKKYAWTTSWGVSTRMLGGIVMVHGDDKGLVLPPKVAPTQVVIVPIFKDNNRNQIVKEACKIRLNQRTFLDNRDTHTPGWKFNEWEMKGVPIRIEIGPKDIQKKQVVVVRRDTGTKEFVPIKSLQMKIDSILDDIQKLLYTRAVDFLKKNTHSVVDFKEFKNILEKKRGYIKAGWCGSQKCEENIKEKTTADIRIVPFKKENGKCILCGKQGQKVYFAKAY